MNAFHFTSGSNNNKNSSKQNEHEKWLILIKMTFSSTVAPSLSLARRKKFHSRFRMAFVCVFPILTSLSTIRRILIDRNEIFSCIVDDDFTA